MNDVNKNYLPGIFTASSPTDGSTYSGSCWTYTSYPCYWYCCCNNIKKDAFNIAKILVEKEFVKIKDAKEFIRLVEEINKTI
jgi:hypothetical protein